MSIPLTAEPPPLFTDAEGAVRVGGSRVTLDTVVSAFDRGHTAEEIQQQYPTLSLADIYAAIGYILRHRPEVSEYLARRKRESEVLRAEIDRRTDLAEFRRRLLARRFG